MLAITVSDPKKESEGMNSYISYKVCHSTRVIGCGNIALAAGEHSDKFARL